MFILFSKGFRFIHVEHAICSFDQQGHGLGAMHVERESISALYSSATTLSAELTTTLGRRDSILAFGCFLRILASNHPGF